MIQSVRIMKGKLSYVFTNIFDTCIEYFIRISKLFWGGFTMDTWRPLFTSVSAASLG